MTTENKSRKRSLRRISRNFDDDTVDPRIKDELECLNTASETINKFELLLQEARDHFRQLMTNSTYQLNGLAQKIGVNCIDKARPFYEARKQAKGALKDSQQAAVRYEWAISTHTAAKEMVHVAEQGFYTDQNRHDSSWQEMLNHATLKVNDSEKERIASHIDHKNTALVYNELDMKTKHLQKKLKSSIKKAKPYFDMHSMFNRILEEQKSSVQALERGLRQAKGMYSGALKSLERISEEIHARRREAAAVLTARECGVGAQADSDDEEMELDDISNQTPDNCDNSKTADDVERGSVDSEITKPSRLAIQFPPTVSNNPRVTDPTTQEVRSPVTSDPVLTDLPPVDPVRRKLPIPPQTPNSPVLRKKSPSGSTGDNPPGVVIRRRISGPVTAQHKSELRNLIHRLSQIVTEDYQSDDDIAKLNKSRPLDKEGGSEKFSSLTLSSSKVFHCENDSSGSRDVSIVSMNEGIFTNIGAELSDPRDPPDPQTRDERPTTIGQSDSESNISHLQLNDKLYVPFHEETENNERMKTSRSAPGERGSDLFGSSTTLSSGADNGSDEFSVGEGDDSGGSFVISVSDGDN